MYWDVYLFFSFCSISTFEKKISAEQSAIFVDYEVNCDSNEHVVKQMSSTELSTARAVVHYHTSG